MFGTGTTRGNLQSKVTSSGNIIDILNYLFFLWGMGVDWMTEWMIRFVEGVLG